MRGQVAVAVGIMMLAGCVELPATTRTAVTHEIKMKDRLSSTDLSVHVGDEVQWTSQRSAATRIEFPGLTSDMLSCQRGFRNFIGMVKGSTTIASNQSASLCFNKTGVYKYTAKVEPATPGGKALNESGTIRVTTPAGGRTRGEE
jgi:plastocyanin